jgi:hypothetical protein
MASNTSCEEARIVSDVVSEIMMVAPVLQEFIRRFELSGVKRNLCACRVLFRAIIIKKFLAFYRAPVRLFKQQKDIPPQSDY